MSNLQRHVENMRKFGLPVVISINRFSADTAAEIKLVEDKCKALGVEAIMADHWAMGGEGAADVAKAVVKATEGGAAKLKFLYPDEMPLFAKIETIAKEIYRAKNVTADKSVKDQLKTWKRWVSPSCRSASPRRSTRSRPTRTPRRAGRSHHQRARGPAVGRRRVRRGGVRRDHDHARPAESAGRRHHRRRRRWQDRRVVLSTSARPHESGDPVLLDSRLRGNERGDAMCRF